MPSDITRTSDDLRQSYKGPVMQQGRVVLDRDFNSLQQTTNRALEADALDMVGPCGTPDDGFKISLPTTSPPDPPLWTPPVPLGLPASDPLDFLISPGTMYVGGQRAVFPGAPSGEPVFGYSYFDQPDWIRPTSPGSTEGGSPPDAPAQEYVYLRLFEQEVSAVEDPDLKDVALGGPDTTQRLRLTRRVERMRVQTTTCDPALAQATDAWLRQGFLFDPKSMRLAANVKLKASFTQPLTVSDRCDPIAQGGYLGAENQLIRVQITNPEDASQPKIVWSYDNASFIYRVTRLDSKTLKLDRPPVDAFHNFFAGQVVEVLRTSVVLASEKDATDPSATQRILRCVAEPVGRFFTLDGPLANGTVTLQQALAEDDNELQLFLRIWQGQAVINTAGSAPISLTDERGQATGLQVTLSVPPPSATTPVELPDGAFWMIAVRPGTPQSVYPERFLEAPQSPDGPNQWICSLAVIDWTGGMGSPPGPEVHDCREPFDNLVELTKRQDCCAVTLRPEDFEVDPAALQKAADKFAGIAEGIAICLKPGAYALSQPLFLDSRHSGLTIEACHGAATLQADPNSDPAAFEDGLIVLSEADGITLQGLSFEVPAAPLKPVFQARTFIANRSFSGVSGRFVEPRSMIGLRVESCADLKVESCLLNINPPAESSVFAAAILASGDCTGLTVSNSEFVGPERFPPVTTETPSLPRTEIALVRQPSGASESAPLNVPTGAVSRVGETPPTVPVTGAAIPLAPSLITEAPPVSLFTPAPPFSILLGFLMVPAVAIMDNEAKLRLPAVLDLAAFLGNSFAGLTVAILCAAESGTCRIQDNTITDCFGGVWLDSLGLDQVNALEKFLGYVAAVKAAGPVFVDINEALELAMFLPEPRTPGKPLAARNPPTAPTGLRLAGQPGGPGSPRVLSLLPPALHSAEMIRLLGLRSRAALSPRFHVANNQIDALPGDQSTSGFALLIFTGTEKELLDLGSSILVNSNELRASLPYYAVLIASASNRCVTGNLILNFQPSDDTTKLPLSLAIFPPDKMAVTGNVLNCRSNLGPNFSERTDIQKFDTSASPQFEQLNTWKFLNFEPLPPK